MIVERCLRLPRLWTVCVQRGDVHTFRASRAVRHEQSGVRLAVILQSDAMLPRSTVVVAATSQSVRPASFRPVIRVDNELTRVLVEQLAAVDVSRLGEKIGHLSVEEMWAVDDALALVLGFQ
jgi:mRNA interferase MazF